MSLFKSIAGVLQTLIADLQEEWDTMDHKLYRLGAGAASFAVAALFWYYVFRGFHL